MSGLLWAVWARWTMGSEWRGTPEVRADHKLITSGYGQAFFVNVSSDQTNKTNISPLRYTRHPIYTGVYFIMLGEFRIILYRVH